MSAIEWTDATWNPVIGCTPVSPGCLNCYAATMANRMQHMPQVQDYAPRKVPETRKPLQIQREDGVGYAEATRRIAEGKTIRIAEVKNGRAVFTGDVRCLPERLTDPLHWKKPRMVFVNSMSDLFHESVSFDFVDQVFAVMALCPQHTFQILTKRPERMREYLSRPWAEDGDRWMLAIRNLPAECVDMPMGDIRCPLPNVWLGTSVEDQARADERIPHLLACPAAVRFLSCEPLLGKVDLRLNTSVQIAREVATFPAKALRWVIVGGESGGQARPCDVGWIRAIVQQCQGASVPVFVKQLGTKPIYQDMKGYGGRPNQLMSNGEPLKDRKGSEVSEWPEELRVREMPRQMPSGAEVL